MESSNQKRYLRSLFSAEPDRVYLISAATGTELSRGQVERRARVVAYQLLGLGLNPGDAIGFLARNSTELALLYFAAWTADLQVVPVNPQLGPDQVRNILAGAAVRTVVSSLSERSLAEAALSGSEFQILTFSDEYDEPKTAGDLDVIGSDADVSAAPPLFGYDEDDGVAFLRIYTSGSTAEPKGIDLSYASLVGNELAFGRHLGITSENRFYNILPMSYLGGIHNLLLLPLANGGSVVIDQPLGGANLYGFWETVKAYRINTLWFTSAMLSMLMALRDDEDMGWVKSQITLGLVGMAPLQPATKTAFENRFGFRLHENYAMSETAFVTSSHPGLPFRPGSSGTLLEDTEVDILGPDGEVLQDGETGEIRVRSPFLMLGYSNASAEDVSNSSPDGFHTGDLAYVMDGELFVVGRKKDLIIRGGLNISPSFVESIIVRHPDVAEACVVGARDPIYGEEVVAAVQLVGGTETRLTAIEEFLAEALPMFQRPKKILVLDQLPKGMTGKIDKKQVRQLFD